MTLTYIRSVLSAFAATCLFVSAQISFTSLAHAQTVSDNSDLVARHQIRLDTIDSELRDLRGVLETDLRSLRIQLDKLADTAESADLSVVKLRRELNQEIARLDDTIGIMEQRLRRTIELSSDIEFRVLRLEKRMETLIALNLNDGTLNGNLGTNNTNNSGNALSANGNQTGQAAAQRTPLLGMRLACRSQYLSLMMVTSPLMAMTSPLVTPLVTPLTRTSQVLPCTPAHGSPSWSSRA